MTQPRDFFQQLIQTPSPTGFEEKIQSVVRDYMTPCAATITTDMHGNVIAAKTPDAPLRVMLAGHCDLIGLGVALNRHHF